MVEWSAGLETLGFSLGNVFLAVTLILLVRMTRKHVPKVGAVGLSFWELGVEAIK